MNYVFLMFIYNIYGWKITNDSGYPVNRISIPHEIVNKMWENGMYISYSNRAGFTVKIDEKS